MTKEEIAKFLREGVSQPSDFAEPIYKVWWQRVDASHTAVHAARLLAEEGLPLFLARMLRDELKKRNHNSWIEVD